MQDTTSGNESTKTIPSNSPFFFQSEVEPHFHLYQVFRTGNRREKQKK